MKAVFLLFPALTLAACATGLALAPAGQSRAVARSALVVTPPEPWNRLGTLIGPGKDAEQWTLDGTPLNDLTFYGGIEDNYPLFREVDRRDRPLPRFSRTMLPPDVAALLESSYRVAAGTALFTMGGIEPTPFAGRRGFRFTYEYTLQGEEVQRKGEAIGTIAGDRLYLVTFEAPAIHYYDRDLPRARAVVASARLATTTPGR